MKILCLYISFNNFTLSASMSWIQTLEPKISSQLLYQLCYLHQLCSFYLRNIYRSRAMEIIIYTLREPGWDKIPAWLYYLICFLDFQTTFETIICCSFKTLKLMTLSLWLTHMKWSSAYSALAVQVSSLYVYTINLYEQSQLANVFP